MGDWVRRHKLLLLVATGLIALLVFAACGDDDDDNGDEPQPTVAADQTPDETPMIAVAPCERGPGVLSDVAGAAAVSSSGVRLQDAEPLKIGVMMALTGGLSAYGPTIGNGAELAAKCINDAGGVNGAMVELIVVDTQTDGEAAIAAAEQLVNVDGVVALVGPLGSGVTLAVAEAVAIPNEVLLVSPSATGPVLTALDDNDYVFRTTISDAAQGPVLAQLIEDTLGLTSVCTMYVNNAYGQGLTENFAAAFGGTVTAQVSHEEEGISFVSELGQCVEGDPEALVAMSYTTGQADIYLKEALENDVISNFVFVDGTKDPDVFAALGWENFDNMYGTAPGALTSDFGQQFTEMYAAEFGEPFSLPFVGEGFDAVMTIALAAQAAGTNTDSAAIRDSLRDVANAPGDVYGPTEGDIAAALAAIAAGEDIDYQGASGAAEFDENGDVSFGAIEIWQVQGEEIVSIRTVSVDLETGEIVTVSE